MSSLSDLPLEIRVGGALTSLDVRPLPAYAPVVCDFLGELSRVLLPTPEVRTFPDLAAFAYWCRPANLSRLARESSGHRHRIGRGLVLHIAPATVPINFAFSLAFGMLAGNANVVRIPDTQFAQVPILCGHLKRLFSRPEYARVAAMNRVVSYPRSDEITSALTAHCQARVLWGGDATVNHLRKRTVPPRCIDVAFADRYSLCLLDGKAVAEATDEALEQLAQGFFNDAYLMDQNACSSPQLVVWHGEASVVDQVMLRFWPAVERLTRQKYELAPVHAVDKFTQLCRIAIGSPEAVSTQRHGNFIYRIRLRDIPSNLEAQRGQFGIFREYVSGDLAWLPKVAGIRTQTLTCFGFDRHALAQQIINQGLVGIDRVVPVGRALDMGVVWDGYDVVDTLSRIIAAD